MYEKRIKYFISFVFFVFLSFSIFSPICNAVFYEDSFPFEETGLTGGAFVECNSNIGSICIVLPKQYTDSYFTFTTSGNLLNLSSSTISCLLFANGIQYNARFQPFGGLQYRVTSGYYDYIDVVTSDIVDTNIIFSTASERINENYYFNSYEICIISVLLFILFFEFMGWLRCRQKI